MEIIRLTHEDCQLLMARYTDHANSQRRIEAALARDDACETPATATGPDPLDRVRALRQIELDFAIDLGSLCYRYQNRDDPELHPLERRILDSIAIWRNDDEPDPSDPSTEDTDVGYTQPAELWIIVDRVRALRSIAGVEGHPLFQPARR